MLVETIEGETTADHGLDYMLAPSEVVFPPGILARKISIQILDDDLVEPRERVSLRLVAHPQNGNGATVGDRDRFNLTILNDDLSLPPTIDPPGDQETEEDQTLGPIFFVVGDDVTPVPLLEVSVESSNSFLLPDERIVLEATQDLGIWSLSATPTSNAFGQTEITIHVSDGTHTTSAAFLLTVEEQNDLPLIIGIPFKIPVRDEPVVIDLELQDLETSPEDLFVYFTGTIEGFNIASYIQITGNGAKRQMTIRRPEGYSGTASIQLFVVDSGCLCYGESFSVVFGDGPPLLAPPIHLEIIAGAVLRLTWEGDDQLYTAEDLGQPFTLVPDATSPYEVELAKTGFFILRSRDWKVPLNP